jgi:hypothetical protein
MSTVVRPGSTARLNPRLLWGVGAALVVVLLFVVLGPFRAFSACVPSQALPQPSGATPGKISAPVARLIQASQQGTLPEASQELDIQLDGDRFPIAIAVDPCRVTEATAAVQAAGGRVASSQDNILYAYAPASAIPAIAEKDLVMRVDVPVRQGPLLAG